MQPNISQKGNLWEYIRTLNLLIKYAETAEKKYEGFVKLKQNPNIENFNKHNVLLKGEQLVSPSWVLGVVLYVGPRCHYFEDFQVLRYPRQFENALVNRRHRLIGAAFSALVAAISLAMSIVQQTQPYDLRAPDYWVSLLQHFAVYLVVVPVFNGFLQDVHYFMWAFYVNHQFAGISWGQILGPSFSSI